MIKGDCDNADDDNDSNYSCANGNNMMKYAISLALPHHARKSTPSV